MTGQYHVLLGNAGRPGLLLLMPVYRERAMLDPRGSNCAPVAGYTAATLSSAALFEKTLAGRIRRARS